MQHIGENRMSKKRKELLRTVKFTLFSISAGVVQIASFAVFADLLGFKAWVAHLLALILSVVWNFTLNRKFTFNSATNVPIAMLKVAAFYLVFTPLSTWWTAVFTAPPINIQKYIVEGGTMLVNFITEYLFQRFLVFGKSIDSAKKEK